ISSGFAQTGRYTRKSISYVDVLLVTKKGISLSDKNEKFFLSAIHDGVKIARFDYNPLPEKVQSSFRRRLSRRSYSESEIGELINETIVPELVKILDIQKEIRARNLVTEVQRNSFIVLKSKEMGITAAQLEQVMNSSYLYVPFLSKYKVEKGKGKKDKNKKDISVSIKGGLIWYHLIADDNPRLEKIVAVRAEGNASAEKGKKYSFSGRNLSAEDYAFISAAQTLVMNLQVRTREIDMFKLQSPIAEVVKRTIRFPLGKAEGIKMDEPFFVGEWVESNDGKIRFEKSGFVRVGTVTDNKTSVGQLSSAWAVKKGDWVRGMMIIEHPRLGIDISVKPRWFDVKIEEGGFQSENFAVGFENFSGGIPGVDLDFQCNIASLTKKRQTFLVFGGTGAVIPVKSRVCSRQEVFNLFDIFSIDIESEQENNFATYFNGYIGYMRKFYFGPLALHSEALFGLQGISVGGKYNDENVSIVNIGFGGRVNIGLEYAVNIDCNVGVFAGYNIFTPMNLWYVKYNDKEEDITDFFEENYPKISSVSPTFGFYVHFSPPTIPFNPFAMMRKG
ncbi:MAG: hypothetical protein P9M03_07070, partial [Candidatus Theseobacter exili]|nr:hypothetical protein [Candidatus Theseobacter exili]